MVQNRRVGEAEARRQDPRVKEVNVRLSASHEAVLVMASDGTLAADVRPLVRLDVSVIVEQDGVVIDTATGAAILGHPLDAVAAALLRPEAAR